MMEMRFTKIKLFQVVVLITLVSPLEIDRALVERFHYTAAGGDVSVVAEMLRDGIPVDICDQTGRTALYYAAITNRKGVVNELLNNGANVNVRLFGWLVGCTPLRVWLDASSSSRIP